MIRIRAAHQEDCAQILQLIKELADFEELSDQVLASEEDLKRDGFGESPRFECLIAEDHENTAAPPTALAFALFFHTYSTFAGRPGLYLEDIYVRERARGLGVGRQLLSRLAVIAQERGCPRLDLSVLHWNPARSFYEKLGFRHQSDWLPYRLEGDRLQELAATPENTTEER
ncbi:GNAT family N-acetyltransferase [Fodinicurvata fenggangensis]|uniref:GNAT family N-acetyltransferase n=1 Tax=Fodinicurvata fenggangensis TaxID=1121830 RepID=UPI00054D131B|nr:GNAT family N-acetyltransferase [Fodinicurvata fenggangensis]